MPLPQFMPLRRIVPLMHFFLFRCRSLCRYRSSYRCRNFGSCRSFFRCRSFCRCRSSYRCRSLCRCRSSYRCRSLSVAAASSSRRLGCCRRFVPLWQICATLYCTIFEVFVLRIETRNCFKNKVYFLRRVRRVVDTFKYHIKARREFWGSEKSPSKSLFSPKIP